MGIKKYIEDRPWGNFEQFCRNENCSVKIITVNPQSALSLQYHEKRDEFYRVLAGAGELVVGEETKAAGAGDEFWIPRHVKHRVVTRDQAVKILEISFGEFDENDIVRLEDKYGRPTS